MIVSRAAMRAIGEGWAWIFGRRQRIRVTGRSMVPTLAEGEFVLVDSRRTPAVGDVVVARHPTDGDLLVIKRVSDVQADGPLILSSDNPKAGTDSRLWGPVGPDRILGVVTLILDRAFSGDVSRPGGRR